MIHNKSQRYVASLLEEKYDRAYIFRSHILQRQYETTAMSCLAESFDLGKHVLAVLKA